MALKHPPRDVLLGILRHGLSCASHHAEIVDEIIALYDQANPDDPATRTANEIGTMYKQLRGTGITDKDAMALIEMALRTGALMRAQAGDTLAEKMAALFKPVAERLAQKKEDGA